MGMRRRMRRRWIDEEYNCEKTEEKDWRMRRWNRMRMILSSRRRMWRWGLGVRP